MKKQLLLFSFEDEFTKNFLKTLSETQKEEIRRALKEIIMRYFEMNHKPKQTVKQEYNNNNSINSVKNIYKYEVEEQRSNIENFQ